MNEKNEYYNLDEIKNIIDEIMKLEKSKNKLNIFKIILFIFGLAVMLFMVVTISIYIYKNKFSFESMLSTLLAFFSIFISIFFYFKANETSNRFYDNSYNFMKEVSVTLGKIEERFGEKLNTINDKISHLSIEHEEKQEALQNIEDEKQKIINELMDKAKIDNAQKDNYRNRFLEKEIEAENLRQQLYNIDNKYRNMLAHNREFLLNNEMLTGIFSTVEIKQLKYQPKQEWSIFLKKKLVDNGYMTPKGEFTNMGQQLMIMLDKKGE